MGGGADGRGEEGMTCRDVLWCGRGGGDEQEKNNGTWFMWLMIWEGEGLGDISSSSGCS